MHIRMRGIPSSLSGDWALDMAALDRAKNTASGQSSAGLRLGLFLVRRAVMATCAIAEFLYTVQCAAVEGEMLPTGLRLEMPSLLLCAVATV